MELGDLGRGLLDYDVGLSGPESTNNGQSNGK